MDYPKTNSSAYPAVEPRKVPTDDSNQTKSSNTPVRSTVTLAPPVKIEFGINRVWVSGGGKASAVFCDGEHAPTAPEGAVEDFHFAPSVEEGELTLHLEAHSKKAGRIKGLKLEFFKRESVRPFHRKTWTGEALTSLLGEGEEGVYTADVAWGDLELADTEDTPGGFLTLAGAPYQLRMVVSAKDDPFSGDAPIGQTRSRSRNVSGERPDLSGGSEDVDKFAYPLTAWTFVHVLTKEINVGWGEDAWLDCPRADLEALKYQERILGTDESEGDELTAFKALKEATEEPKADSWHELVLPCNLFARVYNGKEEKLGADFEQIKGLWGDGARVPLVAEVKLQKIDNEVAEGVDPKVLVGSRLLWDWDDPEPDRWKQDQELTSDTQAFMDAILEKAAELEPKGSSNCPAEYGGKLGDEAAAFFLPSDGSKLPFKVEPCKKRTWAALSEFADPEGELKGKTGVLFQPSRMAGDTYRVRATLFFDSELDDVKPIDLPECVVGSPGKFEVFHKVDVRHVVVGALPNVDLAACRDKAKTAWRTQAKTHLEIENIPVTDQEFREHVKTVAKERPFDGPDPFQDSSQVGFGHPDLFTLVAMDLDNGAGEGLVPFKDADAAKTSAEALIRDGTLAYLSFHTKKTPLEALKEAVVGLNTQAVAYPLYQPDLKGPNTLVVFEADKPLLRDGEQVKGSLSGNNYVNVLPAKACSGTKVEVVAGQGNTDYKPLVKFPGGVELEVKFETKRFSRSRKTDLSDKQKVALREKLAEAGAVFADSTQAFEIEIECKTGDDQDAKDRSDHIKTFLEEELKKGDAIIDKEAVLQRLLGDGRSFRWTGADAKSYASTIRARAPRDYLISPAATKLVAEKKWAEKHGVYVFHVAGYSNLYYLPNAMAAWKQKATLLGAFDPQREFIENDRSHGFVNFVTPDPQHENTVEGDVSAAEIFGHELGHALWLPHAPAVTEGRNPASAAPDAHVTNDACLMNYDREQRSFCGFCQLRLRGWDSGKLKAGSGSLEYQITIELDDVDENLFLFDASTPAGKAARLQVLSLLNRPLGGLGIEQDEAFDACWEYAKVLLDGLDTDAAATLKTAVEQFVIEKGALPADGKFARIRLPGGFTPCYSMSDLIHRYPDHHDGDEPNPEDAYALGAERAAYEDMLYRGNAALGTIPLKVTVQCRMEGTTDWKLAPDAEVFVGLTKPDTPPSFGANTDGFDVGGGKSFLMGVEAPPLKTKPKAFISTKVDGYQKSASSDPEAGNVHFHMGGKRGQSDKEEVGLSGGVLAGPRADGFSALSAVGEDYGEAIPHAVPIRTDSEGVARLSFRPSRIGGDRYKLEAFVVRREQNKPKRLATAKTGTMVVWRTVRVCHYFKHDPPTALSQPFKDLADTAVLDGMTKEKLLESLVEPLEEIKFSTTINEELAKSYVELILDPGAQSANPIPNDVWTTFEEEVDAELEARGKTINKPSLLERHKARPFLNYYHTLTAKDDERKVFEGTLPSKTPGPDTVYARFVGTGLTEAFAQDHLEPNEEPASDAYNLKAIAKGGKILGRKDRLKSNDAIAVKGKVDYTTGEVTIEFEAKQDKEVEVGFVVDDYIDIKALYDTTATDVPGLFRMTLPAAYDQKAGADFLPMGDGKPKQAAFLTDRIYNLATWVFAGALLRALKGNKQSYLPGLILIQSDCLDPYDALYSRGQEGKGMGNGVLLFRPTAGSINELALHELGHGLFLQHAPGAGGAQGHLHDPADGPDRNKASTCMMSYSLERDGDHCGMCVANLRGMRVRQKPLRQPKVPENTEFILIELKDEEGKPVAGQAVVVTTSAGEPVTTGVTNELGLCRLDEVPTKVKVSFPELDGREWGEEE